MQGELSREILLQAAEALEYRASCLFGVDDNAVSDDMKAADAIYKYLEKEETCKES